MSDHADTIRRDLMTAPYTVNSRPAVAALDALVAENQHQARSIRQLVGAGWKVGAERDEAVAENQRLRDALDMAEKLLRGNGLIERADMARAALDGTP